MSVFAIRHGEPQWPAYRYDRPSIDRQRPTACETDAARTRPQRICACPLQSDAARERDLRARRPRRQGRRRPRPRGVELRRVRGANAQANPGDDAGLAHLPGRMPARRDTGTCGCPRRPGDHPVARSMATQYCSRMDTCCACSWRAGSGCLPAAVNIFC